MASLWKILGGIGSVAASFIPGVGPVVSGLLRAGGTGLGLSGLKSSDGGSSSGSDANPGLDSLLSKQSSISSKLLGEGSDLAASGEATIDKSLHYLMPLLGGDKTAVTQTLAPEYDTILQQYDTARKTASETGPRGGAKGEAIAESTFKQADALSRLLQVVRREAANSVTGIGESRANRGVAKEATGIQSLDQAIASLTAKRGQNLQTYGDIGQGIGSVVASLLLKR